MTLEFWQNVLATIVAGGLLTLFGSIMAWLVKSYKKFTEMVVEHQRTNELLDKTLSRLDKHEERLDAHDELFHRWKHPPHTL